MNEEQMFDIDFVEEKEVAFDPSFDLSFKLFVENFGSSFQNAIQIDERLFSPVTFKAKTFQKYVDQFNLQHQDLLSTRPELIREMYLLHQTSRAMYQYNEDILGMKYTQFRSHFYFPNIIYLLIRYLPNVRQFLQKTIKSAYYVIQKKNSRLTYLFENAIYTDIDVIRTDVLYTFLGNSLKKINPLEVQNVNNFYRQVFLNHFFYYFKCEQKLHSRVVDDLTMENYSGEPKNTPTRESLYREVLTNLQIEKYRETSPTMRQLHYNYSIFKNVIVSNEFQSIFLTSQPGEDSSLFCNLNNSQYKILSFYDKIMSDEEYIAELKKLPLIYKLLKSVHLITKNTKTKLTCVKKEVLVSAVADELSLPFKNMLNSDVTIRSVLMNIADNFISSILTGEYISLQTLAPIKIDQLSFIVQLRKFIKLCLVTNQKQSLSIKRPIYEFI